MMNKTVAIVASIFAVAIIANLILINYTVFKLIPARLQTQPTVATPAPQEIGEQLPADSCGIACQQALQFALKQVDQKIATLSAKTATSSSTVVQKAAVPTSSPTKESFIPMGTGSTTKSDWEDVAGSDVYINTSNYPNIQQAYFEVSMHIPTKNGTVFARLYNVTDKHPVWYSDVSTDRDTSTFLASKITLDPGNKQYRIQLKTSLEYQSVLDSARIKVISQ